MAKTLDVAALAKELGLEQATVRVQLRKHGIKKDGKAYSWDQKGFAAVVKTLKSGDKVPAKKKALKAKTNGKKPAKETADAAE